MCSESATKGLVPFEILLNDEYATAKIGIAKIKKGRYIKGVPASIMPVIERVDNINPANKAPESPIKILAGL